jgi:HK97 family phage prohead protease
LAKKLNAIEHLMSRSKDFRGKHFDVVKEMGNEVEPVVFGGYAVVEKTVEEIAQEYEARLQDPDTPPESLEDLRIARDKGIAQAETRAKSRVITFKTTTTGKDRHGTRVRPEGIDLSNYTRNPVFLWGHDGYGGWFSVPDMEHVIGKTVEARKSSSDMEQDVEFTTADVNPKGDRAFRMVKAGFLQSTSIGFIPKQIMIEIEDDDREVPIITKSELLETSLVTIPSNPEVEAFVREMVAAATLSEDNIREEVMPALVRMLEQNTKGFADKFAEILKVPPALVPEVMTPPASAVDTGVVSASVEAVRTAVQEWLVRTAIRQACR